VGVYFIATMLGLTILCIHEKSKPEPIKQSPEPIKSPQESQATEKEESQGTQSQDNHSSKKSTGEEQKGKSINVKTTIQKDKKVHPKKHYGKH